MLRTRAHSNALRTSCSSCLGRSDRPRLEAQSVVSGGAQVVHFSLPDPGAVLSARHQHFDALTPFT